MQGQAKEERQIDGLLHEKMEEFQVPPTRSGLGGLKEVTGGKAENWFELGSKDVKVWLWVMCVGDVIVGVVGDKGWTSGPT